MIEPKEIAELACTVEALDRRDAVRGTRRAGAGVYGEALLHRPGRRCAGRGVRRRARGAEEDEEGGAGKDCLRRARARLRHHRDTTTTSWVA